MTFYASKTLLAEAIEIIKKASSGFPYPNRAALAKATGESEANISRWINGISTPTLKKLEPILKTLGVGFSQPYERKNRPALIMPKTDIANPENFIQIFDIVPVVGTIGADVPPIAHRPKAIDWVTIKKEDNSADLWAIHIAKTEYSMADTINPDDTLIIDRSPIIAPSYKDIYLVQTPPCHGSTYLIRRAHLEQCNNKKVIIFYSDNAKEGFPPIIYGLNLYHEESINNAIKGRVSHIWSKFNQKTQNNI